MLGIAMLVFMITVAICLLVAATAFFWWVGRQQQVSYREAQHEFARRREWLEADFANIAPQASTPRGLRWESCEFQNDLVFALDRTSRKLSALISVLVKFEAIEGGGMDEVAAVANYKAGTAIFFYEAKKWQTKGRTVFNLSPEQTIGYFNGELLPVDDETSLAE